MVEDELTPRSSEQDDTLAEALNEPTDAEHWAEDQKIIGQYLRKVVANGHYKPDDDGGSYVTFDTDSYGPVVVSDYLTNLHPATRNSDDRRETLDFLAKDGKSTLSFQFRRPGLSSEPDKDTLSQVIATKFGDFDPTPRTSGGEFPGVVGDGPEGDLAAAEVLDGEQLRKLDLYAHPIYGDMIAEITAQIQGATDNQPQPGNAFAGERQVSEVRSPAQRWSQDGPRIATAMRRVRRDIPADQLGSDGSIRTMVETPTYGAVNISDQYGNASPLYDHADTAGSQDHIAETGRMPLVFEFTPDGEEQTARLLLARNGEIQTGGFGTMGIDTFLDKAAPGELVAVLNRNGGFSSVDLLENPGYLDMISEVANQLSPDQSAEADSQPSSLPRPEAPQS